MTRIARAMELMARYKVEGVILKDETTIRYLTGFTGDSSLLFLDGKRAFLITDGRYTEQAKQEMKFFKVYEYKPTGPNSIWAAATSFVMEDGLKVVGFDGACYSFDEYNVLKEMLGGIELVSIDFSGIRIVKDNKELEYLLTAANIADQAFNQLLKEIKPGVTERDLAARLEYYMRVLGSEKVSFDTIVASGERSALPHGIATDRVIEVGDFVTFDFGAVFKGYHSDMTRTVVVGMASPWQKEIYGIVEEAQRKGMKAAKVGMTGKELDAIVREVIERCGYGEQYIHGTGHGVGLEIHELPNVNKRGEQALGAGMVFSIEPGIYIPGKGGVRIEDTVVLTENGARALNGVRKQLIEIV